MNRITFPMLALGVAPVFCWAAEPQPKASDDSAAQLKAAQDERIKLLTQNVEILTEQYKIAAVDFPQVFSAECDLWNAQLDSTDEPEKRIALLTKQLDRANDFVKLTQGRFDAGTLGNVDLNRTKSLYLNVKIKLLRERSKMRAAAEKKPAISQAFNYGGNEPLKKLE